VNDEDFSFILPMGWTPLRQAEHQHGRILAEHHICMSTENTFYANGHYQREKKPNEIGIPPGLSRKLAKCLQTFWQNL